MGGEVELNRPGGIFEMGVLFCLAKTMVSVIPKELDYKVENHKHEKLEVMKPRINKRSKLPAGKINHPVSVHMKSYSRDW